MSGEDGISSRPTTIGRIPWVCMPFRGSRRVPPEDGAVSEQSPKTKRTIALPPLNPPATN